MKRSPATTSFEQEVTFNTTPEVLYDLLMDPVHHAAFTGQPARITARRNGRFSVWGDYITGKFLDLQRHASIKQEWHAADMPKGHVSVVTITLTPLAKRKTLLTLRHEQVPADMAAAFQQGWHDYYWKPMKAYLKSLS